MAEGLLRAPGGERIATFSAGSEATFFRSLAIRAMAEIEIDMSHQESKTLDRYLGEPFDAVITVCDQANETCPVFFAAMQRLHWNLPFGPAGTALLGWGCITPCTAPRLDALLGLHVGARPGASGRGVRLREAPGFRRGEMSPDPSRATGAEEEQLVVYREVRDELRRRIESVLFPLANL
jgi:protein-tyrosine-phosphatase